MNIWLQLLLTTLSWAATFHVSKYIVAGMPPLAAAIWRFAIAALFLLPLTTRREGWSAAPLLRNAVPLLVMGAVGILGFQVGMFYGLKTSSAANAALISGFNPALTAALSALVERRRIRWLQWAGLLLGIAGLATVISNGRWQNLLNLSFGRGDLWLLGGTTAWAVYSVVLKRHVRGLGLLQTTTSAILIGMLAMIAVAVLWVPGNLLWPSPSLWLPLLFIGVVGTGFAYIWWNAAVSKLGAARASTFMNLVPLFTIAIGIMLGETASPAQFAGAALVIGGVVLAVR